MKDDRFWKKVKKGPGCWMWTGFRMKNRFDYGVYAIKRKPRRAHRVAWMLARGPIPRGKWVLHKCDTPGCVRPSHLFLGTALDNAHDMIRKGRAVHDKNLPRGSGHKNSKLNETKVASILRRLASGEALCALAREYGVANNCIFSIKHRETWAHVVIPAYR